MRFTETPLPGAYLIELEPHADERGFFARSFCQHEFEAQGLSSTVVQCNVSYNKHPGTLRGMHYQAAPHAEVRVVRVTAGAIYDVIVDLRADSPCRFKWYGVELSAENRAALYVPEGFAHGFLTLTAGAEVFYLMSAFYEPDAARGVRWDDPQFSIEWPAQPVVISDRDRSYPDFEADRFDG